jgi:hypothetical protein
MYNNRQLCNASKGAMRCVKINYIFETTGIWKGLIESTTWIVICVCGNVQYKEG